MPRQAAMMDKLALLRGVQSVENDHFLAEVYTGLPRAAGKRPAFGSVVSRLARHDSPLPPMSPERNRLDQFEYEATLCGASHAVPAVRRVYRNLAPVKTPDRLEDRRALLDGFTRLQRHLDQGDAIVGLDRFQARALEMISSPQVREAFDFSQESPKTIERYGRGKYTHQADKTFSTSGMSSRLFLLPPGRSRRAVVTSPSLVGPPSNQAFFQSYHTFCPSSTRASALVTTGGAG
jgi:hypothetical protein